MFSHALLRSDALFAMRLLPPDPSRGGALTGRIEHVMSGRRHYFDSDAALLECLRREQLQVSRDAAAQGGATSGTG